MNIHTIEHIDELQKPENGCVITIGNFDGLHLGHQAIFKQARELANEHGLPLFAMTFEPAPVRILRPDAAPGIITPIETKIPLFRDQDIDHLIVVKTTKEFLSLDSENFVKQILVDHLGVKHIVEGTTFNFGKKRVGSMMDLDDLARQFGFTTHLTAPHTVDVGEAEPAAVSSTLIRQYISESAYRKAATCMGRDFVLAGRIVSGRGDGRKIGFPTLNLGLYHDDQIAPTEGVFAGYARFGKDSESAWRNEEQYPAAISIGTCDTFDGSKWQIEAFLLDCPASLELPFTTGSHPLGEHMMLTIIDKTRSQKKFNSTDELVHAIHEDCRIIREVLRIE